ncbi:MAG: hypothetical protein AAGG11_17635 [Pseudomonadota bacterium]
MTRISGAPEPDLAVEVLLGNGSQQAMVTLERAMLSAGFEEERVINWLRTSFLERRGDGAVVELATRLIQAEPWPATLKHVLLEAMFDYRPEDWYPYDPEPPEPPATLDADAERARARLLEVAQAAGFLEAETAMPSETDANR